MSFETSVGTSDADSITVMGRDLARDLMGKATLSELAFLVVHQAVFGVYLGKTFAPNHKGMPHPDGTEDFLRRQVLTARNVKAHPFTDFWYGGLNYQIEHHLFPTIPRNKLGEAQTIVKAFCHARSIPYHETGLLQSYRELLQHLHQVSAPLREETRRRRS